MPIDPADLERHNRLGFNYARAMEGWPLLDQGQTINVATIGNAQVSDGEALRRLTLAGLGLARLAAFQVKDDIAAGRLQTVLEDFNPGDIEEVHAVFLGQINAQLLGKSRPVLRLRWRRLPYIATCSPSEKLAVMLNSPGSRSSAKSLKNSRAPAVPTKVPWTGTRGFGTGLAEMNCASGATRANASSKVPEKTCFRNV